MLAQRKKVLLAVAASVGVHALLLVLWALSVQWLPHAQVPTAEPEKEPIKVTLEEEPVPPTPSPVAVPTPPPVHFLDTSDMAETATPPPDARVQSAKNTADASELPAEGSRPGPTQKGRKVPSFIVATRDYRPGEATGKPVASDSPPPPAPQTAPPLPRAIAQAPPKPPAAPAPAATPLIERADFALAEPFSLPKQPIIEEQNPYDPSFRPPSSLTEPPRPTPAFRRSTYQPSQLKTAAIGSISNLGSASIATAATPTGRYQGMVKAAIKRRWDGYIASRLDLLSVGTVTIQFLVGMDGKARSLQVVANTANDALASISLRAIMDAEIPPMPADAVPKADGGQLVMVLPFELLYEPRP